jgi:hypothetical protein
MTPVVNAEGSVDGEGLHPDGRLAETDPRGYLVHRQVLGEQAETADAYLT